MKPEAQRIAIAEACGWRPAEDHPQMGKVWTPPSWCADASHYPLNDLPDYLGSLDAMHEAENILPVVQRSFYCNYLMFGVPVHEPSGIFGHWQTVNATAAQRAEAFLRTIGKWKEAADV